MKIECILRRPGGTKIQIAGADYHFKPEAGNDGGPHVADVADEAHAKRLLAIREGYRPADSSSAALIAPSVVQASDDALVLTVPQPPTESALVEVLTALGAADPHALLSIAWPDRFPAKDGEPQANPPISPPPAPPVIPNAWAEHPVDPVSSGQLNPYVPTPSLVIGAVAPASDAPANDDADGDDINEDNNDIDEDGEDEPGEAEKRLAAMDDAALRAEFERVVGRRPSGRAQRDTLMGQILSHLSEG